MRVAIVASSALPQWGRLERRVDQLARGLCRRGVEVEILAQSLPGQPAVDEHNGVIVRRFPAAVGGRVAVTRKLWDRLQANSDTYDLVDVHTRSTPLALTVARTRVRRLMFTPGASIETFLGWPYARATRAVISSSSRIVCRSEADRVLVCDAVPRAADRVHVVPDGVDTVGLTGAEPFATRDSVVLAVDRLDHTSGVARAIAAMASLDRQFRLVVIGDGPARARLVAYAGDLRISSRVLFLGQVPDETLYRWFRTARVVVALADKPGSGLQVTEARAAGASVVISDLPTHRQAAEGPGPGHVILVPPRGSPLDVADAIAEAARRAAVPTTPVPYLSASSWESVVERTLSLYRDVLGTHRRAQPQDAPGVIVGAGTHLRTDGSLSTR